MEVRPEEMDTAKGKNGTYVLPLHVRDDKKYMVAVGVLDGVTRASGFGRVEVDLR